MPGRLKDSRTRKFLASFLLVVFISVLGMLGATGIGALFFLVKHGSLDPIFLDEVSNIDVKIAFFFFIIGAAVGVGFGVMLWEKMIKKLDLVSDEFIDRHMGGSVLKKK